MNRQIKMIGLDLDGTLLTSEKKLTDYTREVLEKAIGQGVVVLVATGRPIVGIPKELIEFPGMKYAVTANGARVVDVETGEMICENLIPLETAMKVMDVLEAYDCHREIFIEGKSYAEIGTLENINHYFRSEHMAEYTVRTRIPVESLRTLMLEKNIAMDKVMGVFHSDEEHKEAALRLKTMPEIVASNAIGYNWEMNKADTDKGNALLQLGQVLGIQREEIMACGDGLNDYEMLKKVGFAVAMENAVDEVKAIADYVTETNDEDGVAKAIERFVLK